MNTITMSDECRVKVNGTAYSQKQLDAIVNAAWILCSAYERAEPENGGGGSVSWDELNDANNLAREGFGADDELREDARQHNDYEPALSLETLANTLGVAPLLGMPAMVERKRADDTEGGSCD